MNTRKLYTRIVAITLLLFLLPTILTGCAKRDRLDGAVDKGVATGKQAITYKQGAQDRVNNATAILDGK